MDQKQFHLSQDNLICYTESPTACHDIKPDHANGTFQPTPTKVLYKANAPGKSSPVPGFSHTRAPRALTLPFPLARTGMAAPRPAGGISMLMSNGDVLLGEVEVFPARPGGNHPFPINEICISHLSPPSDRCPPLAVLQVIGPKSMRCKIRAKPLPRGSPLQLLHSTCLKESKVRVSFPQQLQIFNFALIFTRNCGVFIMG